MNKMGEPCVLQDRTCIHCGECDRCDLDPAKQCDNCCQCIDTLEGDYAEIEIDDILLNSESKKSPKVNQFTDKKFKLKKQ